MSGITVLSRTQRIVVNPQSNSVSVINAGPPGMAGLAGVSPEVDMFEPFTPFTNGDKGILTLVLDEEENYDVLTIDSEGKLRVGGPLTDAELRAEAVLIDTGLVQGLTDDELRATPVPVSGTITTGGLTDVQLRTTPVPVSGTVSTGGLSDTQLRATPVPVSGTVSLDAPSLAAIENVTVTIDAESLAALETINIENIVGTEFAEDSAHTSGDAGVLALVVRRDADTPSVSSDGDYSALHTDSEGKLKVSGPLTDIQLRATALPISGTVSTGGLTDVELRSTPVPVSGPLTDAEVRATPLPISGTVSTGGLSDAQLRATPVSVSGTIATGALTDAQLRATSVPVALDATSLAALESVTVVLDASSLASLETINVANIAGTEFAEDSAHVDGAAGSLSLAVRRDADTSSVTSDGDYAALLVDAIGRLKVKHVKDNSIVNGTMTIAISQSLSSTGGDANNGIIDLRGKSLVGIQMPAVWTAAVLTFSASMDGGVTYNDLYDDTMTERSISVVANRSITLDPTKFMGVTHLKFRSGTGAAAVNQAAARTINYTTISL